MKKISALFGFIAALSSFCKAQGDGASVSLTFPDSVRIALENTRSLDGGVIGAGFFSVWPQLGVDQQMLIKKQSFQLKKRKFPLKTHVINYFGAIVNAISVEKAEPATLSAFLKVAEK
ncbi:MAG TPA: hypothetical protein VF490_01285, partial [Chryseosolibacter sp.]